MIGKRLSNYELKEKIGQGGMGIVYRAYDHALDRMVAIKIIPPHLSRHPDVLARFQKEARAAAGLNHSAIVEIYGIGRQDDIHFFVMEYLDGSPLEDILEEDGRLAPDLAVTITARVAGALDHAHRKGFVHRDIKPSNIIFNRESGVVKVTDFGIAKALEEGTQLTASDVRLGTPRYMSPEQVRGEKLDPRSDLFSLGVVLFQMLTGAGPFGGDSFLVIMRNIIEEPPLYPSDSDQTVPEGLRSILNRLLAKDPDERYGSAAELLEDIEQYRSGGDISPAPASPDNRYPLVKISGIIILAAAVGGGVYLLSRVRPPRHSLPIAARPVIRPGAGKTPTPPMIDRAEAGKKLFGKGAALEKKNPNNPLAALAVYEELCRDYPDTDSALKARTRIEAIQKAGDYKKWFERGLEAMVAQNWTGAAMAFQEAVKLSPTSEAKSRLEEARYQDWKKKAETSLKEGEKAEALTALRKAEEISPQRDELKTRIADIEKSITAEKKKNQLFRKNLAAGKDYIEKKDYSRAIKSLESALSLKPDHPETRTLIGEAAEKMLNLSATLEFTIEPAEADLYIDGIYRGTAADFSRLTAPPGEHIIEVREEGYIARSRRIITESGKTYPISITLKPYFRPEKRSRVRPIGVF